MNERVVLCLIKFLCDYAAQPSLEEITDKHWLFLLFDAVFGKPPVFGGPGPLGEEEQKLWLELRQFSRSRTTHDKARETARELAEWLDVYLIPQGLQFDDKTLSVWLNGTQYSRIDMTAYAVLKLLSTREGQFYPSNTLAAWINADNGEILPTFVLSQITAFPEGPAGKKRISRAVKQLPPDLRNLIQSRPRHGWQLLIPLP